MDHARAVKEYSRSSADQDVPLPHELRPAGCLQRTMDYLVAEVIDAGAEEGQWADWYEFLWSRTRGIRKVRVPPSHTLLLTAAFDQLHSFHVLFLTTSPLLRRLCFWLL